MSERTLPKSKTRTLVGRTLYLVDTGRGERLARLETYTVTCVRRKSRRRQPFAVDPLQKHVFVRALIDERFGIEKKDSFPAPEWPGGYSRSERAAWWKALPALKKEIKKAAASIKEVEAEKDDDWRTERAELVASVALLRRSLNLAAKRLRDSR